MSDIVRLKTQTQIDNEAAVWTWRLDCGGLTQAERRELETWLRQDFRHRRAFEELGRTWSALDRLTEHAQREETTAAADVRPEGRRRAFARLWQAAAAAVLILGVGVAVWTGSRPGAQVVSTAVGQLRHVTLADGSQLTLNTNTLLAVKLAPQRRDIYLRRGEAHFDVVHDASRPFFVHAGEAVIRDVGTQFDVRLQMDKDIDVLVNEGQVEVQGPAAGVRALRAGQQLFMAGPHLQVSTVSPRQLDNELAWRDGALVFDGEALSQALAEVGRYTRTRIVVTAPEVDALHVSGRFRTDDVPGFFQALQAALPVRVSQPRAGLVYISPR